MNLKRKKETRPQYTATEEREIKDITNHKEIDCG